MVDSTKRSLFYSLNDVNFFGGCCRSRSHLESASVMAFLSWHQMWCEQVFPSVLEALAGLGSLSTERTIAWLFFFSPKDNVIMDTMCFVLKVQKGLYLYKYTL